MGVGGLRNTVYLVFVGIGPVVDAVGVGEGFPGEVGDAHVVSEEKRTAAGVDGY